MVIRLIKVGYSKTSKKAENANVGDVEFFEGTPVHIYGHIGNYYADGIWCSEFAQYHFFLLKMVLNPNI